MRFMILLLGASLAGSAGTIAPFTFDLSALGGSSAVSGTTVINGLNFPYGLALTGNGSLLFGANVPLTQFGIEAPVTSSFMMLPRNGDGSFGAPTQIASGINGPITNVRSANGLTVVDAGAASGRTMTFYDQNLNSLGTVSFTYPTQAWWHSTGQSVVEPQQNGSWNVFFIVGSEADQAKTTLQVTTSGLFSATLNADSVYEVNVKSAGGSLQATGAPTQIATGLRNAYGLALDPNGDLIIGDNGQDGAHVVNEQAADTLHEIAAGQLGQQLFDFGFPASYVNFATGAYVNNDPGATPPLAGFIPVADAHGVLQSSEGLAGMTFVAAGAMPFVGAQGGVFVSFHGVKDAAGAANYDNALLYYDFASGRYTPILDGGTAGVGHLDSLLVSGGTLYLSDMATAGVVDAVGGAGTGAIYAFDLSGVPEPSTWMMGAGLLLVGVRFAAASGRRA